ncbi:hypothetical protein LS482_16065 [Sinomicrobium kalidii]|uniref:hypothetical protein n=1 Tax=Sinomicrobium kalidii TaxID=2900738 RepID=UPI001E2BF396|nr:hypothetical protein [Sinomicrobium kalidii]UGU15188.1 hypothetical protein LS482_16065 [Sinomicrobium kalidii]
MATVDHKAKIDYWGMFRRDNPQHLYILSLLRQFGWTVSIDGVIRADMNRFAAWLRSEKSPVRKPLPKMEPYEVSKIIAALESMTLKKYNK